MLLCRHGTAPLSHTTTPRIQSALRCYALSAAGAITLLYADATMRGGEVAEGCEFRRRHAYAIDLPLPPLFAISLR